MKTLLAIWVIIFLPGKVFSQDNKNNIFGKKWYAVKIFTGGPGLPKVTEIAPEEDCTSLASKSPYFFYIDVTFEGFIKTDYKFKQFSKPQDFRVEGENLIMYFSNLAYDKIQFKIINSTPDFLQIYGPNNKTYFFISNRQLE